MKMNSIASRRAQIWRIVITLAIVGSLNRGLSDPTSDYRLTQCQSYRSLPYDGRKPEWTPYQEDRDPCSLRCRDVNLGLTVVLLSRVPDGTPCRNRTTLDVCVNGTCQSPGCDGQLGSGRVLDRCRVCGGDGSSCRSTSGRTDDTSGLSTAHYGWHESNFSACSVFCGVGLQTTVVKCREKATKRTANDAKCDVTTRPEVKMRSCRMHCDQHVWIVGVWSDCSISRPCGGGLSRRTVFCAAEASDGSFERKWDSMCRGTRPEETRRCSDVECPQWISGEWSPCSSTCSIGIQVRSVVCRRSSQLDCPGAEKPDTQRPCHSGVSCSNHRDGHPESRTDELHGREDYDLIDLDLGLSGHDLEKESETPLEHSAHVARGRHRVRAKTTQRPSPHQTNWVVMAILGFAPSPAPRLEQDSMTGSGDTDKTVEELKSGPVGDNREVSTTPSFVVSSWSTCSALCGTGVRTRRVQCQVFQEYSRSVIDLPESSCSGPKPMESEYCHLADCYEEAVYESYAWMLSGYGACSRSCAGGTQEAMFSCLRVSNFTLAKRDKCQHLPLPNKPPQRCNEQRCPPRWRAFPYGPCSASCGGGQQLRHIRCIYDLHSGDMEEVSDDRCPPPKPPKTSLCNMAPCAPSWNVDSWSKCSVTCGQGVQTRQVRCEQKVSLSNVATVNESLCPEPVTPPQGRQPCDMGECPNATAKQAPIIYGEASSFVQLKPLSSRVIFVVGGTKVLIPGTTVLIYCPVRDFNKTLITWRYGAREVTKKGRIKVSPKGILRIRNSRESDAGVYTCTAGEDAANVTLAFHTELAAHRLELEKLPHREPQPLRQGGENPSDDEEEQRHPFSLKYLLRSSSLKKMPLQFYPHPWSACSKTCGGSGLQSRDISCEMTMEKGYTLVVNDSFCLHKGLTRPIETRDCGFENKALICPSWETGPWRECTDESCSRPGFGVRRRSIDCLAHNGTRLDHTACPKDFRPTDEEQCEHQSCKATWKTSNWTKCSISCGGRGVKNRSVECVWESNGEPASTGCEAMSKPESTKSCYTPACAPATEQSRQFCRDESKYCNLIPKLHMCRYPQYRRECCYSCNLSSASGHQPPMTSPRRMTR